MKKIIEVQRLEKSYGDVKAVKGIDFYVEEGTLFAFLGTNGAGKSTTIDILSTQLASDSGEIRINNLQVGKDDDKIRSSIGIVFQDNLLDPLLTVSENLFLRGSFYGLRKAELKQAVERAAKIVGITDLMKRPYGKLSGGQRRRADIARALINTPKILFLDEPTTGLDPQTRKKVWETIRSLQQSTGMTVFLTTHYMEEAAQADYITIIGEGEIKAKGTPLELKERYSTDMLKIKPKDINQLIECLNYMNLSFTEKKGLFHIPLTATTKAIPIIKSLEDNICNLEILNGTMDDVFINLTESEGEFHAGNY